MTKASSERASRRGSLSRACRIACHIAVGRRRIRSNWRAPRRCWLGTVHLGPSSATVIGQALVADISIDRREGTEILPGPPRRGRARPLARRGIELVTRVLRSNANAQWQPLNAPENP
jgi:hypothetical protein